DLRVRKGTFPRELHHLGWNRCQLEFIHANRDQGSDISLVEFDVYGCGFGRKKDSSRSIGAESDQPTTKLANHGRTRGTRAYVMGNGAIRRVRWKPVRALP